MGIKNLHRFLRKYMDSFYHEVPLSTMSNMRFAVDTNVYLFKYKSIHKDKWLTTFMSLLVLLKKYNIHCIFVYDTKSPIEKKSKKDERKKRKKNAEQKISEIQNALDHFNTTGEIMPILQTISQKRKHFTTRLLRIPEEQSYNKEAVMKEIDTLQNQIVSVSRTDIKLSKQLLSLLGIPYIDSDNEAETLCAHLCCHSLVDAVLSDDTDVLVYGTPLFVTKLNMKRETCIVLNYDKVIGQLELTKDQFTDLCIMSGTDYNDNITNIGNEKSFKLLKKYGSIDALQIERPEIDISVLNHQRVREIFKVPVHLPDYNLKDFPVNMEELQHFAVQHRIHISVGWKDILEKPYHEPEPSEPHHLPHHHIDDPVDKWIH